MSDNVSSDSELIRVKKFVFDNYSKILEIKKARRDDMCNTAAPALAPPDLSFRRANKRVISQIGRAVLLC